MSFTFFSRLSRLLVILFFQVLVFNQIHLFGYITPLMIGYMIVCFHRNTSRTTTLLWGFATGLLFDMFSNTAGMAAAACTLAAMIQQPLLNVMTPHDTGNEMTPSFSTLGFWNYMFYVLVLMLVLHTAFYLLDAFTLANWKLTTLSIICSSLFATITIFFIELLVRPRNKEIYQH